MATTGDVSDKLDVFRAVCLLGGAIATNGAPSGAAAGVPCNTDSPFSAGHVETGTNYYRRPAAESTLFVFSTAGSGTMTVTLRLWGYLAAAGKWAPLGTGGDTTKGGLNAGAAIGETTADAIQHCEPFIYGGHFDRLYVEVAAIGGTSTSVDVWMVTPRINTYD